MRHLLTRSRRAMAALTATAVATVALAGCGSPPAPSAGLGTVLPGHHPVPATLLVNQFGKTVSLRSFKGKYVVLASFLTLCQEECPLTTGVFQELEASVKKAGLSSKVAFVEATVDPGRDTPARLRAYDHHFGADWTLLTGTSANVNAFWSHFGVWYQKVSEGKPAEIDWWTGKPLTYDVDHDNGFILISPSGNERFITIDIPYLHGKLSRPLRSLLDSQGVHYLDHGARGEDYTVPQALGALSWLMGRHIALA